MEFRLPPLGEGIDTVTVTAVAVRPGDHVQAGQNVLTVETDKAAVEVPIDTSGLVEAVLVQPGDKIPIDTPILRLRSASEEKNSKGILSSPRVSGLPAASSGPASASKASEKATIPSGSSPRDAVNDFLLPELGEGIESATITAVLVRPGDTVQAGQNVVTVETDKAAVEVPIDRAGLVATVYVQAGDKIPVGGRLLSLQPLPQGNRATLSTISQSLASRTVTVSHSTGAVTSVDQRQDQPASPTNGTTAGPTVPTLANAQQREWIPASPAARRLARELGVSLNEVPPSGRGGRVTLDDIKNFVRTERQRLRETSASPVLPPSAGEVMGLPPLPDFSKYGPVEVREVSTLRQTIAKNLTLAWRAVPMVTQHDHADITELEAGRKRIVDTLPPGSPKITMTVLAIKACVAALKEFPQFNSSFDIQTGRLIYKRYYHIGIAVDTKEGLVVPVVRDADKKSIRELAAEVQNLAEKARARQLRLEEMRGGTFTISNLGGIGGTAFTPIVNYPEVAILGLSRSSWQAVVREGQIVTRLILPLSLTYDHRVIDGADGCRFLTRLVQLFSDPLRLLMET
jgi:pyruvate dehydrogenase E2 component (dihydrolipoamide acetyltransferase)